MNILIAPDKFKGTLTAVEVCRAVRQGLELAAQDFQVREIPLADGGEGTLDVFIQRGWQEKNVTVHDPLMRRIGSRFAVSPDGCTACVEMASASGLRLLSNGEYDPLRANSYGTGELILQAIEQGVREIWLGIGGSACNDAGMGMMTALGMKFLDSDGLELPPGGASLGLIEKIDGTSLYPGVAGVSVVALTDVVNPFYGPSGAAAVFGPQKGATPEMVHVLDAGMRHLAELLKESGKVDLQRVAGSGAGGGIAGGAVAWLKASVKSGIEVILDAQHVEEALSWADVVITGEGKLDVQTLQGKVVAGVVRRAQRKGKPVVVICGQQEEPPAWLDVAVFSLLEFAGQEALRNSADALRRLTELRVADWVKRLGGNEAADR